jgi:hypothetical protein
MPGWTAPPTEVPGNAWTGAIWNTYIRDNLNFLHGAHACRVWNSTNQGSIVTSTPTPINFDSEAFDSDGFHSTSSNTSRMTVPTGLDGFYIITGCIVYNVTSVTGYRAAKIVLNGTAGVGTDLAEGRLDNPSAGVNPRVLVTTTYRLVATDYVELVAFHTLGSNEGSQGGDINQNQLSLIFIGV